MPLLFHLSSGLFLYKTSDPISSLNHILKFHFHFLILLNYFGSTLSSEFHNRQWFCIYFCCVKQNTTKTRGTQETGRNERTESSWIPRNSNKLVFHFCVPTTSRPYRNPFSLLHRKREFSGVNIQVSKENQSTNGVHRATEKIRQAHIGGRRREQGEHQRSPVGSWQPVYIAG